MSRMSDFDDSPFSLPQNWGNPMDLLNFFFTSEDKRYLRQTLFKFLQQLNDYNENALVLKSVDDVLASHYASLTIKSSHFVWSITLQNLNQFQQNFFFFGISIKKVLSAYEIRGKSEMVG